MGLTAIELINYLAAGALVGCSINCFFFNINPKNGTGLVSILKIVMSIFFCMEPFTSVFLDLDLGDSGCFIDGKFNTVSFHVAMICVDAVLLSRASVVLGRSSMVGRFMGFVWLAIRVGIALADCFLSVTVYDPTMGSCNYMQHPVTGLLYLISDMTIDIYVSSAICVKLFEAIQARKRMRATGNVYSVLIESNLFRTVIIFSSNLIQFLAILLKFEGFWLLIFWSLSDLAYLYLVTYDTALIRFMSASNTRNTNHAASSGNNTQNHVQIPISIKQSVHVQQEYEMMDQDMYHQGERFEKGDIPLTKY